MDHNQQQADHTDNNKARAISQFVASHPDGVIATVTADGKPQASVVYFSVDDKLDFFFTTKHDTRKAQNIATNAEVSLSIHDATSQTVVKAAGQAQAITDQAEAADIYQRTTIHGAQTSGPDTVPPIARIAAGEFIAFRITPDFLDITSYSQGDKFTNAMEHINDETPYGNPN